MRPRLWLTAALVALLAGCAADDGTWGGKAWYPVVQCRDGSFSTHCTMLDGRKGPDRFIKW